MERGFPTFVFDIFTQYQEGGPDYIYSLLTGYAEGSDTEPDEQGVYENHSFIGGKALAMAPPLSDELITYAQNVDEDLSTLAALPQTACAVFRPRRMSDSSTTSSCSNVAV